MAIITQTYNLDIVPNAVPLIVDAHQSDASQRQIAFALYSSNGELAIPAGATAYFEGLKPDNNVFSVAATMNEATVTVSLIEQITALAGDIPCQIKIVAGGAPIMAANFVLRVQQDVTVGADTSETVIPGLVQQAQQYAQQAQQAAENIDDTWFINGATNTQLPALETQQKTVIGAINQLKNTTDIMRAVNSGRLTSGQSYLTVNRSRVRGVGDLIYTVSCAFTTTASASASTELAYIEGVPTLPSGAIDIIFAGADNKAYRGTISAGGVLTAGATMPAGVYSMNASYITGA